MRQEQVLALSQLAVEQHQLFTLAQAEGLGVSGESLRRAVAKGWLRRPRRGVYAFSGARSSVWEPAMAAVLGAGPGAALSHRTAAAIHQFPEILWSGDVELSVPKSRQCRMEGVVVHRTSLLTPADVEERRGVLVTSPVRTLIDLAGVVEMSLLTAVLDEGALHRRWTYAEVAAGVDRVMASGRRGVGSLRQLVIPRVGTPIPGSALEREVLPMLAPFAPFEVQYAIVLEGQLVILDVAWPVWKVAAEIDGWEPRARSRSKFDRDRNRGNLLLAHGWRVAHLTSAMDQRTVLHSVGRLLPARVAGPVLARWA
jgi:hypothetical protein